MPTPYKTLVETDKFIAATPTWVQQHKTSKNGAERKLVASLRLGRRAFKGLELIGRARLDMRDRYVSFTLAYLPSDNRRDIVNICRIDWRPLAVHANDHANTPPDLLGDVVGTHIHPLDLNWSHKNNAPLVELPIAREISPDYQSYNELLDGVANLFRIPNAGTLPSPWPQELF